VKNIPDVVVHFAAYTNVSEAEKQKNDKLVIAGGLMLRDKKSC